MQFLYPIGLLALAGLIIPLIIHLWNVKQSKTLKIGSIALLGESSRASSRSFKINDWLLLILRLIFLILVAFIIAQPILKKVISGKNKGWILVEKSNFKKVYNDNIKTIDSLLKLGYELHDFNTEFALLNLIDTTSINEIKRIPPVNKGELLTQLNQQIPAGTSVYLFANHQQNNIGHKLPEINYKLNWMPVSNADTMSSWISELAGKKYEGKSDPSKTVYSPVANSETSPIKIAIYESAGKADKKYLIAALNAIGTFSNRKIEINPPGKVDLGFWLADVPVSAGFKSSIDTSGSLFQYESGKVISEASFIIIDGKNIPSVKRIEADNSSEKLWIDGFGNPILSKERKNNINIFHFYSRFNPQWNELVWNNVFVKALMPIVINDKKSADFGFEDNPSDQRNFFAGQKQIIQVNKTAVDVKTAVNKSVANIFWFIAFLILLAERILSFRPSWAYPSHKK